MTRGLVSIQGGRLIQVQIPKKDKHRTAKGWPPYIGNKYSVCKSEKSGLWKLAAKKRVAA